MSDDALDPRDRPNTKRIDELQERTGRGGGGER